MLSIKHIFTVIILCSLSCSVWSAENRTYIRKYEPSAADYILAKRIEQLEVRQGLYRTCFELLHDNSKKVTFKLLVKQNGVIDKSKSKTGYLTGHPNQPDRLKHIIITDNMKRENNKGEHIYINVNNQLQFVLKKFPGIHMGAPENHNFENLIDHKDYVIHKVNYRVKNQSFEYQLIMSMSPMSENDKLNDVWYAPKTN